VLEALTAGRQLPNRQVGLGKPGLRPRFERDPSGVVGEREGALKRGSRLLELAAQEVRATGEGQRE
jgi:hypothetical protein